MGINGADRPGTARTSYRVIGGGVRRSRESRDQTDCYRVIGGGVFATAVNHAIKLPASAGPRQRSVSDSQGSAHSSGLHSLSARAVAIAANRRSPFSAEAASGLPITPDPDRLPIERHM